MRISARRFPRAAAEDEAAELELLREVVDRLISFLTFLGRVKVRLSNLEVKSSNGGAGGDSAGGGGIDDVTGET